MKVMKQDEHIRYDNPLPEEDILGKITAFADRAHGGQLRKYTPERYIVHPVRVMKLCREYTADLTVLAAALLHDVLEDTPVSREDIRVFLSTLMTPQQSRRTLDLVVELTDVFVKSAYPQWNRRKRKQMEAARIALTSADAQTIKYADILDNSREILQHDPEFGKKFLQECRALLLVATRGNKALHTLALQAVEQGLATL